MIYVSSSFFVLFLRRRLFSKVHTLVDAALFVYNGILTDWRGSFGDFDVSIIGRVSFSCIMA